MGCSPQKQFSENLKRSNKKSKNRRSSTMSRRSTVIPVEQDIIFIKAPSKLCLKIDIRAENPKFVYYNLDLSSTQLSVEAEYYSEIYNEIRYCYSIFSSDLESFYFLAHKVCLNKTDFSDLLKVLVVSVFLNKNIQFQVTEALPFIKITGFLYEDTKALLDAWEKLAKTLQKLKILKPKFLSHISDLQKFKNTVDYYSEFVIHPHKLFRASKYLFSAIETAKWVLKESAGIESSALNFFSGFKVGSLKLEQIEFSGRNNISAKEIVHQIINVDWY